VNRSVTIVLCAVVVWAAGLGEETEGGLKPQKRRQTKISNIRPAKPEIVGGYVLIYKPQPDIYTGKDTKNYKAGQTYTHWQPNDHTFIKGPDHRWHCFGITRLSATRNQSRPIGVDVRPLGKPRLHQQEMISFKSGYSLAFRTHPATLS